MALLPGVPPTPAEEAIPIPTPILGFPPFPTFASAVPRGDGDG